MPLKSGVVQASSQEPLGGEVTGTVWSSSAGGKDENGGGEKELHCYDVG